MCVLVFGFYAASCGVGVDDFMMIYVFLYFPFSCVGRGVLRFRIC